MLISLKYFLIHMSQIDITEGEGNLPFHEIEK